LSCARFYRENGEDRIIYDHAAGNVYLDRDGDGTTNEQVLFAVIVNKADLTNADFVGF
jgi:hypothetical protein